MKLKLDSLSVRPAPKAPLILSELSLEASAGEILVVLGPSGCGKTTLLRAIAGLVPIDTGKILFDDQDITSKQPSNRDVSLVFQSGNYYDHWTIDQHLSHDLLNRRKQSQPTTLTDVLTKTALAPFASSYPDQLSGGQRQRLSLARAFAANRQLLLLDEPLVHLDEQSKQDLLPLVYSLRDANRVIIYVTHDSRDAMLIADRMAVIADGRITQVGVPKDIYENPNSLHVARMLGIYASQFLRTTVDEFGYVRVKQLGVSVRHPGNTKNAGTEMIMAFRPEHLQLKGSPSIPGPYSLQFKALVRNLRCLGSMFLVELQAIDSDAYEEASETTASPIMALLPATQAQQLRAQQRMECFIDLESIWWFDSESGLRIR